MQTIDSFDFAGKKAFVRVDFNVPLDENFHITDDTRIRAALPTLKKILGDGGSVVIGSHLGRPKGNDDKFSLRHIRAHVAELLGVDVQFASDCVGEEAELKACALQPGEALLLENLRFHAEALMADCFDADHKMFGYLMEKEVRAVEKVLNDINRPFTAIMGGSKVSSKIEIIENLLGKVDNLIICGGMTYTFMKALGGKIGSSICEDDKLDLALSLIEKAKARGVKLVLSSDSKIADRFSNDANTAIAPNKNIPDGWQGLDIGPETEREFADVIRSSKTILWNGPTGVFEFDNFSHGSRVVAEAIVEATKAGAYSLVGGGDSVACINKFGLADGVSYVSTGGGALLEAIEGKVLPGIKAIRGY